MNIEERLEAVEKKVKVLENAFRNADRQQDKDILELDLTLPEADIDGLHFNHQKVHAVFELKDDGKYYSRDILFNSARDTDEGTGKDILLNYLNSYNFEDAGVLGIREQLAKHFGVSREDIEVSLPEENQGIKKYNGVDWWYWLLPRYSGSAAAFVTVYSGGYSHYYGASAVGGCAPAFCVR